MKVELFYEWAIEQVDEHGDINSVDHADTYAQAVERMKDAPDAGHHYELALTRCEGNDADGLKDRVYAYMVDGKLPECFEDSGFKVPQRFHKEVTK